MADLAALSKEEMDALSPEDWDNLKKSTAENEAKTVKERDEELAKLKQIAENQKIRAEKAENEAKSKKVEKPESSGMSEGDLIAIVRAGVADEDIDELKGYATYRKLPIRDAIKDKTWKSIQSEREEERRSAQATSTGSARGSSKASPESVLAEASRGNLPEKDEDIEALAAARLARKK